MRRINTFTQTPVKTHEFCATIIPLDIKKKCFSDLTGASPQNSIRGNLYVIALYDYDSNAILAKPIKIGRHQASAMLYARSTTY